LAARASSSTSVLKYIGAVCPSIARRSSFDIRSSVSASTPASTQLQALLEAFTSYYNQQRPHKSLPGQITPAAAYAARPKAVPGDRSADTQDRVRTDKIGTTGTVTLRHGGKLYHIGIGRAHAGTEILLLVQDLHIRIVAAATGELLRQLTLDPAATTSPPANHAARKRNTLTQRGFRVSSMS
jgi:hypothetical protein